MPGADRHRRGTSVRLRPRRMAPGRSRRARTLAATRGAGARQEGATKMSHVRMTAHFDAPIEQVFALAIDRARLPEWNVSYDSAPE